MQITYVNKNNKIVKKDLPEWLDGEAYQFNKVKFTIIWSMGFPTDTPCGLLLNLSAQQIYAICCLYNAKLTSMKNPYRRSLKLQLHDWLEQDPEDHVFDTPFSPKQWTTLNSPQVRRNAGRRIQEIKKAIATLQRDK